MKFYSFKIKTHVSKGTYIRSLCVDIAKKLGYPGLMNGLVRTRSGVWNIDNSFSLDEIENGNYKSYTMLETLKNYHFITDEDCVNKALHGMKISPSKIHELLGEKPSRIVVENNNKLIAIYDFDESIFGYRAVRVWN